MIKEFDVFDNIFVILAVLLPLCIFVMSLDVFSGPSCDVSCLMERIK